MQVLYRGQKKMCTTTKDRLQSIYLSTRQLLVCLNLLLSLSINPEIYCHSIDRMSSYKQFKYVCEVLSEYFVFASFRPSFRNIHFTSGCKDVKAQWKMSVNRIGLAYLTCVSVSFKGQRSLRGQKNIQPNQGREEVFF